MVSILAAAINVIPGNLRQIIVSENRLKRWQRRGFLYAECGGLMYLADGIIDLDGKGHEMIGVFPAFARMLRKRSLSAICYS